MSLDLLFRYLRMTIITNTADFACISEKHFQSGKFKITPAPNYTKYSFCIIFCIRIISPIICVIIKKNRDYIILIFKFKYVHITAHFYTKI